MKIFGKVSFFVFVVWDAIALSVLMFVPDWWPGSFTLVSLIISMVVLCGSIKNLIIAFAATRVWEHWPWTLMFGLNCIAMTLYFVMTPAKSITNYFLIATFVIDLIFLCWILLTVEKEEPEEAKTQQ